MTKTKTSGSKALGAQGVPGGVLADPASGTIAGELQGAGDRKAILKIKGEEQSRAAKRDYAQKLSNALAQRFANLLRDAFAGILPSADGKGQESPARTAKGYKRLDVNYSTPQLGLGLGVSVKTVNFRDPKSNRYTKNATRIDNEFRAEASDYHERQPYAVLVGIVLMPLDACDDGSEKTPSSFAHHARKVLRFRSGRESPQQPATLFEKVFVGLYDTDSQRFGEVFFFDVHNDPPKTGKPQGRLTLAELKAAIIKVYDVRNEAAVTWANGETEVVVQDPNQPEDKSYDE